MTSGNETRRLQLRLAGLGDLGPEDRGLIDRLIGGHPRALQFVDALLRQGMGAPTVLPKLRNLARQQQVDLKCERSVPDAIGEAVRLAAADIVVDELIGLLEGPETEVLLQVAVSGLPVPLDDLAGVLDRAGVCRSDEVGPAVARLVDLTLLTDTGDGVWVHRWTATALRERQDPAAFSARARRAAQLRRTLFDKSGQLADAIEATDNFLDAQGWDDAAELGLSVAGFLWDPNHSSMHLLLSFATRVSGELPGSHPSAHLFADYAAQALAVLGLTGRAVELAEDNLARCAARVSAEPGRADYQRDLSVSHNKLGDLYQALGRGQDAMTAYDRFLECATTAWQMAPDIIEHVVDLARARAMTAQFHEDDAVERISAARHLLESVDHERLSCHGKELLSALVDLCESDQAT